MGYAWLDSAECATEPDPEVFYVPGSEVDAVRVCARCPVAYECLLDALWGDRQDPHGVRGGVTEENRRRLRAAGDTGFGVEVLVVEVTPRRQQIDAARRHLDDGRHPAWVAAAVGVPRDVIEHELGLVGAVERSW